jgi:hypothetical protein
VTTTDDDDCGERELTHVVHVQETPSETPLLFENFQQQVTTRDIGCQLAILGVSSDVEIQVGAPCVTKTSEMSVQTQSCPDITPEVLDDNKTRFYTGFVNFEMFMLLFTVFKSHGADNLRYWDGEKQTMTGEKNWDKQKPGRKRTLRPIDEFLMSMMKLRLGLLQEHLSDIFKVSTSTVSRTINTWFNFMFDHCKGIVPYPSPSQIRFHIPRAFQGYQNCQIIVDCTEFFSEKASNLTAQWQTWSEYKHHNTFKILIGITPSGMVSLFSKLWGGGASDRHITQNDDFIAKLHPNMSVMADKGFTVDDLLPADIKLNVPPRIPSARPMTESEFFETSHIASARIIVEMKMEQIKNYRSLQGVLLLSEAHLAEQMIYLAAAFTNFLPPLFI